MELLNIYTITAFCSTIVVLVTAFYFYAHYKLTYWTRRGIEQLPNPHIIFGHVKDAMLFRTAPGFHMGQLYLSARPEAPYIGFYIFHKPCLLVRDPEVAKQMFVTDFEIFSDRHFSGSEQLDSFGMLNLFGLKNPAWKFLRTKISPVLTKGKLRQMYPLMIETSKPMMEYLENKSTVEKGSDVKKVDVQDLIFRFTIDSISNIALGTKTDSFHNPNTDYTKEIMRLFHGSDRMRALITVFFIPEIVRYGGYMFLFKLKHAKKLFWDGLRARDTAQTAQRGDFIDALVSLKHAEQSPLYKFEGENLMSLAGMFFSGLESSSSAASFTLLELARNSELQNLAREEIKEIIAKYGWTMEAFEKMKFLEQCIYEGVRMYPPATIVDRKAREDYPIPNTDVVLEKGTPVFISLYGMHSNETNFPEPRVFNPDRFADGQKPIAFMGFGIGPRMCVGVKMGLLYTKFIISKILINYEIYQKSESTNDLDKRGTLSIVADGINVFYRPITPQLDENNNVIVK
ncbi:cytochrome P450 6k1-like [Chelonus insularis]|uniref:cytochrome P450 6k1-like n=1 Tax=Chelonus insularis TaxID=460826 RepID=UPI00158BDAAD|nr:cytochrome P450 6k1-like [Chelonus insularis]